MKKIYIGDVMYDPIKNKIIEVSGFRQSDGYGQKAIYFEDGSNGSGSKWVTAWIAFKYFIRLQKSEYLK